MEAVGNDREKALLRLEEKAELAFEAWSAGDMPDDLYNLRMSQIAEAKQHILDDLKVLRGEAEDDSDLLLPGGPFYVHRYLVALQYGGSEEGGWWYTAGDPDPDWTSEKFETEEEANDRCRDLNLNERDRAKEEEDYEFTSVLAHRSTHYAYDVTDDPEPHSYPEHTPRYE